MKQLIIKDSLPNNRSLTILGSTGTIGKNTIDLIASNISPRQMIGSGSNNFKIEALTAQNNVELLAKQAKSLNAKMAVIGNESLYNKLKSLLSGTNIVVAAGAGAIAEAASRKVDVVMTGIVGAAALPPTLAAIRQGAIIGLANKECLVCAGDLMIQEAEKYGATIIPVDSEHNAIFQCFDFNQLDNIEKITLTASGGPFRTFTQEQMENVTVAQAIKHPNWKMGAKISVDSATMMNKGLEIIEAYHLFPIKKNQIDTIIHPESIIHALVYYNDGSVVAGLSIPDMRVPISYSLGWPNRMENNTKRLDFTEISSLTFEQADNKKFPALKIAQEALNTGGTATAILNAANEIAVENFLKGTIGFTDIYKIVEETLENLTISAIYTMDEIFDIDKQARITALEIIKRI